MTTPTTQLRKLIADDGYAMSFQSMGQYRTALLKTIDAESATPTTQREADERAQNAVHIFTCKGKGGEYELIGYSNGAGPKRGESIVVYRDTSKPDILYHRSANDFRERMEWLGARAAIDQSARQAAPEASAIARDWPEDAAHENGNYMCKCSTCGNTFIGYKRRITCKACAHPAATDQPSAGQVDELLPCPFCGGAARIESNRDWHRLYCAHDDDCALDADDADLMYPAQPGYLLEIAEVWNRRASLTPTAPQAASQQAEADATRKAVLNEAIRGVVDVRTGTDAEQAVLDEVITRLHIMKGAPQAATTASASTDATLIDEGTMRAIVVKAREFYLGYLSRHIPMDDIDAVRADITTDTATRAIAFDLRAALARAPLPAQQVQAVDVARDAARREAWLIANPRWSVRWRIHTKKQIEQWQMVDDGEPWGQWGDYRKVLDTAIAAQSRTNTTGGSDE